jgi:hypothetical protein
LGLLIKRVFYIALFIPLFFSCREVIDVDLDPVEDRIVIFSEISPTKGIDLDLSITSDIFSAEAIRRPQDAIIFMSGTDLPAEATAFIYSKNLNRYELRNRDFRPSPGNEYYITITLPGNDFPSLQASTFVPHPVNIARATASSRKEIPASGGLVDIVFDIAMEIPQSKNDETFLHILPERVFSQYKIDANGEVRITFFANTEPLQVVNILESPNAVTELIHKEGVFVDYSKLNGKMVKLRLSTTTLLDPNIDILENMKVIVKSMTKELFDYHLSVHKQLINNATPFSSSTESFSNVENGLGIFGGYSSSNSLIKL